MTSLSSRMQVDNDDQTALKRPRIRPAQPGLFLARRPANIGNTGDRDVN